MCGTVRASSRRRISATTTVGSDAVTVIQPRASTVASAAAEGRAASRINRSTAARSRPELTKAAHSGSTVSMRAQCRIACQPPNHTAKAINGGAIMPNAPTRTMSVAAQRCPDQSAAMTATTAAANHTAARVISKGFPAISGARPGEMAAATPVS